MRKNVNEVGCGGLVGCESHVCWLLSAKYFAQRSTHHSTSFVVRELCAKFCENSGVDARRPCAEVEHFFLVLPRRRNGEVCRS